ncbi:MAG: acetyl-CoA carboxylase biotin carboxyl carrier protein [Armatimonadota bacterium]
MDASLDVSRITAIVKLLSGTRIAELELQEGDARIRVRRPAVLTAPVPPQKEPETPKPQAVQQETLRVTSPVVGVFRRGTDYAVGEGDTVQAGQTLGAVESLRLLHPVRAPSAGTVLRFLVEDGDPVEYGQDLVELAPEADHQSALQPSQT